MMTSSSSRCGWHQHSMPLTCWWTSLNGITSHGSFMSAHPVGEQSGDCATACLTITDPRCRLPTAEVDLDGEVAARRGRAVLVVVAGHAEGGLHQLGLDRGRDLARRRVDKPPVGLQHALGLEAALHLE